MWADGAIRPMDGFEMFAGFVRVGKNRVRQINVHWITPLLIDPNLGACYTYVKYTYPDIQIIQVWAQVVGTMVGSA